MGLRRFTGEVLSISIYSCFAEGIRSTGRECTGRAAGLKDDDMRKRKNNRLTGTVYEREAGAYLESLGYRVLEYNYRCRQGEIDIVAMDGDCLVFCEVKYRSDASKGMPEEAVDGRKQRVLSKCALYYMTVHGLAHVPCRFDVVGILGSVKKEGQASQMKLYKNAFEYRE